MRVGAWSEWPRDELGRATNHRQMMTSSTIAYGRARRHQQRGDGGMSHEATLLAQLAVVLAGKGAAFDESGLAESYGDWLSENHLIDWQAINGNGGNDGECGKAA